MCSRCRPTHKVRMQRRGVGDTVVIMALSVFMSCNSNNAADAATAVIAAQGATRALARRHTLLQFWRLFDEHTTTPTMNLLLAHPDRRPAAHAPHSAGGGKAPGPGNRRQKWPQQLLMMWTVLLLSLKGCQAAPHVSHGMRRPYAPTSWARAMRAARQRRQNNDTPKGFQDKTAGAPDEPAGQSCRYAAFVYPPNDAINATCVGMDTTVRVCANNDDEAQEIADKMIAPVKTTHGCEAFYWNFCYSIIGPARLPRPFPKFDKIIAGCADKVHETSVAGVEDDVQLASDALRNYCDPHPHLSHCNTDADCVAKVDRDEDWAGFKTLWGCKGYEWFCENIEEKIVRAWEVNGLCTTSCRKEVWTTSSPESRGKRKILVWSGPEGGVGCSHGSRIHATAWFSFFAASAAGLFVLSGMT